MVDSHRIAAPSPAKRSGQHAAKKQSHGHAESGHRPIQGQRLVPCPTGREGRGNQRKRVRRGECRTKSLDRARLPEPGRPGRVLQQGMTA